METTPEPTYLILGGDGQQYGPVDRSQFLSWVRDGRANAQTQILRSDSTEWREASAFPEFNLQPVTPAPAVTALPMATPPIATATASDPELDQRIRSGASWFYWIAGMSVINSILRVSKSIYNFALGLGISRETDFMFASSPSVALAMSAVFAGIVSMFGYFAIRRQSWAFIIGLVLLVLDTVLTVLQQEWFSVAFHAWAIGSIFIAFRASRTARTP